MKIGELVNGNWNFLTRLTVKSLDSKLKKYKEEVLSANKCHKTIFGKVYNFYKAYDKTMEEICRVGHPKISKQEIEELRPSAYFVGVGPVINMDFVNFVFSKVEGTKYKHEEVLDYIILHEIGHGVSYNAESSEELYSRDTDETSADQYFLNEEMKAETYAIRTFLQNGDYSSDYILGIRRLIMDCCMVYGDRVFEDQEGYKKFLTEFTEACYQIAKSA